MQLADTVKITLGPKGRNVVLDKKYGAPLITNDGVTIAKEIELEDAFENMGAQLVKEVSTKTNDVAGDGTTTATLLAQAIIREGLQQPGCRCQSHDAEEGHRKAVRSGCGRVMQEPEPSLWPASSPSPRWPPFLPAMMTIGKLIAEAMEKVGNDGVITVEESKTAEDRASTIVEGMQFDRGYASAYMVTDTDKMEAVLDNPLYPDYRQEDLATFRRCCPCWSRSCSRGKKLLIIAEDVEGEALTTLVRQQAARHLYLRGRQGARLRRSPQGNAAGYRHPDRRPGNFRGTGPRTEGRLPWIMLGQRHVR